MRSIDSVLVPRADGDNVSCGIIGLTVEKTKALRSSPRKIELDPSQCGEVPAYVPRAEQLACHPAMREIIENVRGRVDRFWVNRLQGDKVSLDVTPKREHKSGRGIAHPLREPRSRSKRSLTSSRVSR